MKSKKKLENGGFNGKDGVDGTDGESAYQIAVRLGFKGTEEEWIESLKYDHSDEFQQIVQTVVQKATEAENSAQSALEGATSAVEASESAKQSTLSASGSAQSAKEAEQKALEYSNAIKASSEQIAQNKADIEDLKNNPSIDFDVLEKLAIKDTATGNPCVILDSADWRLQNMKIYGESTQLYEENIVPTPERPIQILSKKIKINEKTTQLRSLKETSNLLFDDSFGWSKGYVDNSSGLIVGASHTNNEVYCDFQPIKPNTIYGILIQTSLEGSTDNLQWCGVGLYDENKSFIKRETISENNVLKLSRLFTTPSNAKYFRFSYRKYTDGVAMLIETNVNPTNYIAPTVRDYKIVDHETKTSKIIRNIKYVTFNGSEDTWCYDPFNGNRFHIVIENPISSIKQDRNEVLANMGYFSNNNIITTSFTFGNDLFICTKHLSTDEFKEFLSINNLEVQYQLKDPVEEEIPYYENDTDDYGYSYQDSKSPSISIPNPIISKEVSEIVLKNSNLFNDTKFIGGEVVEFNGVKCLKYIDNLINFQYVGEFIKDAQYTLGVKVYRDSANKSKYVSFKVIYTDDTVSTFTAYDDGKIYTLTTTKGKSVKKITGNHSYTLTAYIDLNAFQINIGDTLLDYQEPQEQLVTLSQPITLSSTADKKITDAVDSNVIERNIKNIELDGSIDEKWFKEKEEEELISFFVQIDDFKLLLPRLIICDKLPVINWNTVSEGVYSTTDFFIIFKIKKDRLETLDVNGFRKWLSKNPLTILYPLEIPTFEPLPKEDQDKIKALKMYYPNTVIHTGAQTEVTYIADPILYIDKKLQPLNTVQSQLLKLESEI